MATEISFGPYPAQPAAAVSSRKGAARQWQNANAKNQPISIAAMAKYYAVRPDGAPAWARGSS
jgi:hypothetical protein